MPGEYAAIALQLIYERFVEKESDSLHHSVTHKLVVGLSLLWTFFSTCYFFWNKGGLETKKSGEKVDSHDTLESWSKETSKAPLDLKWDGGHWHFFHVPLDSLKILQQT